MTPLAIALFNFGSCLIMMITAWGNYCVARTMLDRMSIINAIRGRPLSGPPILAALEAVPFKRHLRARMFFGDPWKLFDPIVKDAIDHPRNDEFQGVVRVELEPANDPPPPVH